MNKCATDKNQFTLLAGAAQACMTRVRNWTWSRLWVHIFEHLDLDLDRWL